jgi:uncharacterized membrane protein YphA (DoxX/SURF4 family)
MLDARGIRIPIALVWFYQGFWCKVCGGTPAHLAVIRSVPFLGPVAGSVFLIVLGLSESCIAVWVLSGKRPRQAAIVQTSLLIVMNVGGLIWAWRLIPDPAGMVLQNVAFLTLIWVSAENCHATAHI